MSFLTSHVLGSGLSGITTLKDTTESRCNLKVDGDFQKDQSTNQTGKKSAKQPHSPHSVRLSK